jgi:hypothetical protein
MTIINHFIKIRFLFLFSLFCWISESQAQNINIEAGKSAAMSNTSVTMTDLWSVYHNQAGLGYLTDISVGAFHQSGFIKQQNRNYWRFLFLFWLFTI